MKTKFFYLLLVCLTAFSFTACDDDDNNINFYVDLYPDGIHKITSAEMIAFSGYSVTIGGGDGTYTARSSDESVLTTEINENYLYMTSVNAGRASVTVTDKSNNTAVLQVIVSERTLTITVLKNGIQVKSELETPEVQSIIEEIKKETELILPPVEAKYEMTYTSQTGGNFNYYSYPLSATRIEGTFSIEDRIIDEKTHMFFTFKHSDTEEYTYRLTYLADPEIDDLRHSVVQTEFYIINDLTETYSARYPDAKITQVFGVLFINIK